MKKCKVAVALALICLFLAACSMTEPVDPLKATDVERTQFQPLPGKPAAAKPADPVKATEADETQFQTVPDGPSVRDFLSVNIKDVRSVSLSSGNTAAKNFEEVNEIEALLDMIHSLHLRTAGLNEYEKVARMVITQKDGTKTTLSIGSIEVFIYAMGVDGICRESRETRGVISVIGKEGDFAAEPAVFPAGEFQELMTMLSVMNK